MALLNLLNRAAFIGYGKMAKILVEASAKHNIFSVDHITVSSPGLWNGTKKTTFPIAKSNQNAVKGANVIVLGTKPAIIPAVCDEIANHIDEQTLVVSIAAGVSFSTISKHLGNRKIPIIRAMPNTPLSVGFGMTGLCANEYVTETQKQKMMDMFHAVGKVISFTTEDDLNKVTAISGSGPAYFFYIQELMINHAVDTWGISKDDAYKLVTQTMLGAAELITQSQKELSEQRAQVTSPNGTTAAAIEAFKQLGLKDVIEGGMNAAYERAQELSGSKKKELTKPNFFKPLESSEQPPIYSTLTRTLLK